MTTRIALYTDRRKRNWALLWLRMTTCCALLLFGTQVLANELSASVDRQTINLNETLTLSVRYNGAQVRGEPDFSILSEFDVLSNQRSMQHSIVHGRVSAFTEWRLILAPRNTGQMLIPPFSFQGLTSQPITIRVEDAPIASDSGKPDVFLETYIDKATAFVQEQILVTFRLHYNQSVESLDMPPLQVDNVRVETLPRVDYHKNIGDTQYGVAEFRYALFADASGSYHIPEQTWTLRTSDSPNVGRFGFGGGRLRVHRARTKALDITVNPRPDTYPAHLPWLPADSVTLEESWGRPAEQLRVGEPVTRTLVLRARGVSPEQLPPVVTTGDNDRLRVYADAPKLDKQSTAEGMSATRVESIAIVPSQAGELTLPEISVTWWNTARQRVEKATLPSRAVTVSGPINEPEGSAANMAADAQEAVIGLPAAATPSSHPGIWPWLSLALLVCNLVLAGLWWRQSRNTNESATISQAPDASLTDALQALRKACQAQDTPQTRSALLRWLHKCWPDAPQMTLRDLAQEAQVQALPDSAEFVAAVRALDAQLYGNQSTPIHFNALAEGAARLSQTHRPTGRTEPVGLKPLYQS